jgi:hypothetical protein
MTAIDLMADLPKRESECAYNVAPRGKHRQCGKLVRRRIDGYGFCQRHAEKVAQQLSKHPSKQLEVG